MPENSPHSLDRQLANYVSKFLENTGLTQRQLGKLAGIDPANLNGWIKGYKNLSSDKLGKLHQIINLNRLELEKKFTRNFAGRIVSLQERGRELGGELRFDGGGWVAREGSTDDPNDTIGIDSTPTARDVPGSDDYLRQTTAFLKDQQSIYRQAIAHIDNYLANVQKAKVNKSGSTSGVQKVNTNDKSSHPGSRGDLLNTPAKLKERLEFVKRERKEAEEKLELQAELEKERKLWWDARVKATRKELNAAP